MTEELKNAMRNATDEILMTLDKYNMSSEDMKTIHNNLRIILVNQEAPVMYNENKERAEVTKADKAIIIRNLATMLINPASPAIYDVNGNFTPDYAKQLIAEVHPAMESPKVAFVGSKMHSLLTDPEALKQYLTNNKTNEEVNQ